MSYQLQRGQNISLTRLAASVSQVAVGLGWDANKDGVPFNLDTSAFMVTKSGKVPSDAYFIFFNQLRSPDGSVEHQGNNTTGIGAGDDEIVNVNLNSVEAQIDKIVFTVTIYDAENNGQNFGLVNNAYIRIVNLADKQEMARYNLTERFQQETAMVFGELYRYKGEWKFRAVGQGFAGGLNAMANTYGVSVDEAEDDTPPAAPPIASPPPQPSAPPQPAFASTAKATPPKLPATSGLKTGVTGLKYELLYPGAYTMLKVHFQPNEQIKAEPDSMIAMHGNVDVTGGMDGGIMGGLARQFLTGESFFMQTLTASRGPGWALVGQAAPGDIQGVELNGSEEYIVQKGGYLASTEGLTVSTTFQNLAQGLGSGEGFFVIKVSGQGTLFVSSYGAIHAVDIPAGTDYIVDNHHLVAWPSHCSYNIELAAGFGLSSFTSGEMLVCRFRGPARIYIQTRNSMGFIGWLAAFVPGISLAMPASPEQQMLDTAQNTSQMFGNS